MLKCSFFCFTSRTVWWIIFANCMHFLRGWDVTFILICIGSCLSFQIMSNQFSTGGLQWSSRNDDQEKQEAPQLLTRASYKIKEFMFDVENGIWIMKRKDFFIHGTWRLIPTDSKVVVFNWKLNESRKYSSSVCTLLENIIFTVK